MDKKKVLVTGDTAIDWFELIEKPTAQYHDGETENWRKFDRIARLPGVGGALLIREILEKIGISDVEGPELLSTPEAIDPSRMLLSEALLSLNKSSGRYFIARKKGFSGPAGKGVPGCLKRENAVLRYPGNGGDCGVVIINDTGDGFRNHEELYPSDVNPDAVVIYRIQDPFAVGRYWDTWLSRFDPDRIVIVLSADDLRNMEEVDISRSLSWERTAGDFLWHMHLNNHLRFLSDRANLIVLFDTDGAILYNGNEQGKATLIYDPKRLEGGYSLEYPEDVFGKVSVFTAMLALNVLSQPGLGNLGNAVQDGLVAMRCLKRLGYTVADGRIDLPIGEFFKNGAFERIPQDIGGFSEISIPLPTSLDNPDPEFWTILEQKTANAKQIIAENIIRYGKDPTLNSVPEIQFGKYLTTFDRSEIESYSAAKNLIKEYITNPNPKRPLCIAVFGSPGSGKSFGVTQIARALGKDSVSILSFNMSQFTRYEALVTCFHQIRDCSLKGQLPLVFFDEFDSDFGGVKLGWLKTFLAPMQDGEFLDGTTIHPIGKAIFVFAGGTCESFDRFIPSDDNDLQKFRDAKGPDFVSRLRGFINIKGINAQESVAGDDSYILRRAKILRINFETNEKTSELFDTGRYLNIDGGILRAMLQVPRYKHGIRSMTAILDMSRLVNRKIFDKSALPPKEQLDLHVDSEFFYALIEKERFTQSIEEERKIIDTLARAIHGHYTQIRKRRGHVLDLPEDFDKLPEEYRASNRGSAADLPQKLRAIGVGVRRGNGKTFFKMPIITEPEIEKLAEMEHERWSRERIMRGWTPGPRDSIARTSPYLVDYRELSEADREYDREIIILAFLSLVKEGFELYRMQEAEPIGDFFILDKLARYIHVEYVRRRGEEGNLPSDQASTVPFDELPQDLVFSNYNNAYHIPTKLKAAGYSIRPVKKGKKPVFPKFSAEETEIMARIEHDRWNWDRRIQGWAFFDGPKNVEKKLSPYITAYDKLPEDIREYDRQTVRLIPELLAKAGYEAYRPG